MLSLWELLQAMLLLLNSAAILNEERFLPKVGLGMNSGQPDDFSQQRRPEYMTQIAGFINAVQYLRLPLVAVNIVVVVLKLLIG